MTVEELIAALQNMPAGTLVVAQGSEWNFEVGAPEIKAARCHRDHHSSVVVLLPIGDDTRHYQVDS